MDSYRRHIRNFSIIAHIDHGKSTLADRLLEATGAVESREMEAQLLDNMDLERERGITIKARAVNLTYKAPDGEEYYLNLIDTPGHVDFGYEVSRSLNACEGALLVVDATQGIEAQTLANAYLAVDSNLEIVPVINKIDLPSADIEGVRSEIEDVIGIPAEDCPAVSAKSGLNINQVLEKIVSDIPAPSGDPDLPLKALIFDSYYDSYLGVVVYVRIFDGRVHSGDIIRLFSTNAEAEVVTVGMMSPFGLVEKDCLEAGDVGYITASIKTVSETRVGDTITLAEGGVKEPLPGFKKALPMVFSGIYPADGARYGDLRDAIE
ncbi:MAG: GTP-binding protein, partial [Clostridia bacterium]|nr:GTP-binding protein [Clostridia bacterium]